MNQRFFLLSLSIFLLACQQEIKTNPVLPLVTSVYPTHTPQATLIPATATPLFPNPTTLSTSAINLIAIGDDLTRGDGDDMGRGYPGRLVELVGQIHPGSTVTNFAQTGWTSDDVILGQGNYSSQLLRAITEVQSVTRQDRSAVVLVWVGSSDLWRLYSGKSTITAEVEEQDLQRFESNIKIILFELRQAKAEVLIATLDDQSLRPARTRHETYPDITAAELKQLSQQVIRYNTIIEKMAQEHNALIVHFYNDPIFTQPETAAQNGYHLNPAGYDRIYQKWYKVLLTILP